MKKLSLIILAVIGLSSLVVYATTPSAMILGTNAALALIRPCSHKGVLPVSFSSVAAGATGVVNSGAFAVTCFNNSCYGQASNGTDALTYAANTHCNALTANVPYSFTSEANDVVAFIKQSGQSDSTCVVTECR